MVLGQDRIVERNGGNCETSARKSKSDTGSAESQADLKRTPKEFQVGEHVFIKVRPKKSSLRLGRCANLAPRYCGPFEILSRIDQVAY